MELVYSDDSVISNPLKQDFKNALLKLDNAETEFFYLNKDENEYCQCTGDEEIKIVEYCNIEQNRQLHYNFRKEEESKIIEILSAFSQTGCFDETLFKGEVSNIEEPKTLIDRLSTPCLLLGLGMGIILFYHLKIKNSDFESIMGMHSFYFMTIMFVLMAIAAIPDVKRKVARSRGEKGKAIAMILFSIFFLIISFLSLLGIIDFSKN